MVSVLVIASFVLAGSLPVTVVDDDVDVVWWVVVLFVEICCMFETYTLMNLPLCEFSSLLFCLAIDEI